MCCITFWFAINTTAYHMGRYSLHLILPKSSMIRPIRLCQRASYLDPYCDPCQDLVYGSNSSMMDGSFSTESDLAQEQVMAEQRKTLMMSMMRKRMPNATQR